MNLFETQISPHRYTAFNIVPLPIAFHSTYNRECENARGVGGGGGGGTPLQLTKALVDNTSN